ncbi:MAG TPA: DNA internalization-related competence protein ComEC/Rec2 [Gemmatimonadales bacterium]|nr:DNA internalization-related competence protein ComEC/Rec2 [Gemmatimonadales bacterium]
MQTIRAAGAHALGHRPAVVLIVSFEAGLAIGLSHFPAPGLASVVLAVLCLSLARDRLAWLPCVAALGFLFGLAARSASEQECSARLAAGPIALALRLEEPVTSGVAMARPEGCRGAIAARMRGTRLLAAGSRLAVEGRWIPSRGFGGRPAGILVVRQVTPIPNSQPPSPTDQLRTGIARTTARLYGPRAGLVDALLVGRRGGIDASLNAAFSRSGLVHLLSISGFHVGVVFGWAMLLFRALRIRRESAAAVAAALVLLYVSFLGWPAPATRAALLCALMSWSLARQRHPGAGSLLAVTCLGSTLLEPWALFDLGGWLSASALLGAMTFSRWSDRAIAPRAGWRMLFASVGATLATAPLTAAALGSVALAGIALNFAAIPLAALAVPAVLASVLVAPVFPPLAEALAGGGGLGLAGLEALARMGSRLPAGGFVVEPGPLAALPWLVLLGTALWMIGRRNTSRRAALRLGWLAGTAGVFSLVPLGRLFAPHEGPGLSLHFLNVGQGDAALIRTPAGRWILVDAGPAGPGPNVGTSRDAGREVVLPFLVRRGVRRLAAFVLSHAHLDHGGGAPAVLEEIPAELILEPAEPVVEARYLELLELAAERGMRWRPARAGDSLVVDGVRLTVLHPDTVWAGWRSDLNDDSVVLLVRFGSFQAVLAGDLGVRAESLLAGRIGPVDLLKVGHHGSAGSTGLPWLAELAPRAAVISVGANRYGHPAPAALARLADAGAEVWRTDRDGSIQVTVQETTMVLRGRRGTRVYVTR